MPTQNADTTPKKRASEPHIDNNAQTNKNNAGIPVFLLQEILTFEQAVAYLDAYSEPEADEQCIIIGFLSDVVDVETAVEICTIQTVVRVVKDELKWEKDVLKPRAEAKLVQKDDMGQNREMGKQDFPSGNRGGVIILT